MRSKFLIFSALLVSFSANVFAQTGGVFTITESVVASGGGGQQSAGGNFALDGTIGQTVAGNTLSNSPFAVTSGFWNFTTVAPTAANVNIGGQIKTANGNGIRNVVVVLTNPNGETKTATTSSFGYYRLTEVPVGETYILTVRSKRFSFLTERRIITLLEELTDVDFTALPQ